MDNQPSDQELRLALNLPNTVTAVRIVLSITSACLLYKGGSVEFLVAGILIIIAGCTDWLDGFLARRLGQSSVGGAMMDLVADQVLAIPNLILAIAAGLFSRTDNLMPFNPYPYAVIMVASGAAVLVGVSTYLWKRGSRGFELPTPTMVAKIPMFFWIPTLVVAVLGIGPDWLLAGLMYLGIIFTVVAFASYLRKASYVFTD